jgi:uncharacterized protein (TIGR02246 family)
MHRLCWATLLGVAALCSSLTAADSDSAAAQAAIAASADKYEKAFAERDVKALGALFTNEAEYVDPSGTVFHGRAAIEAELTASFEAEPPGAIEIEILSLRPIAEGTIAEDGLSTFRPKAAGPASQTRYAATHVRQKDGSWRIASVRELEPAKISTHGRLEALAWLVGNWREESAGSVVETEWKWSDDGAFLLSDFTSRRSTDVVLKGTHRVGWDAERQQYRSWIFDSTGGAVDGWWTPQESGGWSVALNGLDAEGGRLSSTATYVRDGKDAIVISQQQRTRGGVNLPSQSVRVVRQPPKPGDQAAK